MANARFIDLMGQIHKRFGASAGPGTSDSQLLERFVGQRDESAFQAIVDRHGPLVYGIAFDAAREK